MSLVEKAIKVDKISKVYELGLSKSGSLRTSISNKFNFKKKKKSEFVALNNISFDVNKGEVIGIIGKNGAGKSTLLKILSKITKPTTGRIEYTGRISSLLEVGTGFHPELTGLENIYLNGTILGMKKNEIKEKLDDIIKFSGVEKFLYTPVKHYSSGMYVRLAFSVAAHLEPEILIIDEVLAVGDSDFQKKCIGKMKSIANSGRTVLFVSHNMPAVKKLCSKCVHLQKGEITYFGDVQTAIDKYIGNTKTNSPVNIYDLDQKREGNGNIKFTKSVIKNNLNEITNKLIIGNSFTLNLEFKTLKELNSNDVMFLVSISDNQGYRLTYFKKTLDIKDIKNNSIECKIINPPLNTGLYFFNIALKCNNELEDWIINASNIEIMDSSSYLSKNDINHTEKSPILIANKWK